MRRLFYILVAGSTIVARCWGAPSEIGFLPEEKVGVTVPATERNPFGKRVVKAPDAPIEEKGSEETQIRGIVTKLECGGIIRGGGKTKVLLGSFQVEEGGILPSVIPDQMEKLKVVAIKKDRVEMVFVEQDGKPELRTVSVPFDLGPNVHYKLNGAGHTEKKGAELGGVIKKNDPASPVQ
ncbi:hypothetical protein BH09VER1_BH09VER1_09860 [soil metagenome]